MAPTVLGYLAPFLNFNPFSERNHPQSFAMVHRVAYPALGELRSKQ